MFDHHSREYADGWREIYREARGSGCPVIHSARYGGYDVLTTHADVSAAAIDYRRLSSERSFDSHGGDRGEGVSIPARPVRLGFLEMDPPESTKYRRLINKWFTRQAIERGRDRVDQISTWAVDRVIAGGSCDMVPDLVGPFQRALLLDLLGLPLDKWLAIREELTVGQDDGPAEEDIPIGVRKQQERAAFFEGLRVRLAVEIAALREGGGSGVLGELATAQVDGAPIDVELATELAVMLVGGGDETTIATICSALLHLARNPEDRKALVQDPSLLPVAVDEILRYYPATFTTGRSVREPVEFGGCSFEPGQRLLLSVASANFDDAVFSDPESVDFTRKPNPHLTFGLGAHRCIGALLAHTAVESFLGEFLRRVPDYEVDEERIVFGYGDIARINGYYSIPLTFAPGPVAGDGGPVPVLTAPRISPA